MASTRPRDPYEVLGIARDSDETQIKKAFRKLARELHPDVNAHDPDAEEKFKEVAEAYEIVSDPERRATYDRYGHEGLRSGGMSPNFEGFGSISDLFDAFFGGAFGGRAGRGPRPGGGVRGPPQIGPGAGAQRIGLTGRGHAGEAGGPSGDLYVLVHVRADERFVRDGDDLVTVLDVPAPVAALGATLEVPTIDGSAEIDVPAGTQPGEIL